MCSHHVSIFADFCQLPANPEFANPDFSWLPGWDAGFVMFYVCFCFKTLYVTYIANELTVNARPTALYLKPEECLSKACIFSRRHIMAFLCVGMQKKKKFSSSLLGSVSGACKLN